MQITQKKSRKTPLFIALSIFVVMALAGVAWLLFSPKPTQTDSQKKAEGSDTSDNSASSSDQQSATDKKQQTVEEEKKSNEQSSDSQQSTDLTVTQTASAKNGETYQLRYLIEQTIANGTCTLTLTKGSSVVTKTAPVQAQASISTCQGFDINIRELSSGTWQTSITVQSDGKTGKASSTISI